MTQQTSQSLFEQALAFEQDARRHMAAGNDQGYTAAANLRESYFEEAVEFEARGA